jgi:hypothetical protein
MSTIMINLTMINHQNPINQEEKDVVLKDVVRNAVNVVNQVVVDVGIAVLVG